MEGESVELYKPVNYNGAHDLVSVGLQGHGEVRLLESEVRGRDWDGVAADVIVLGGGRIDRHCLEQRTQHVGEQSDPALRLMDNWNQELRAHHS